MKISIIVAIAENNVIGKDNTLVWRLSEDLKNFKDLTMGHAIVMGRKTHDSIRKALPGRHNIIVTRNPNFHSTGCITVYGLEQAIEVALQLSGKEEVFIIGGAEIYKQALSMTDAIYLTEVKASPDGDAFLDRSLFKDFKEKERKAYAKNDKNEFAFDFVYLERP